MNATPRAPRAWLTIHEASDLIGVSPATLRRWTEAGDLEAFVTPGGHRRFARSSILGMLPSARPRRRRLNELGETPDRVVRQYRRELADRSTSHSWVQDLPDAEREAFREPGRQILAGVLGFLDAPTPEEGETSLSGALNAAAHYGAMARARAIDTDGVTDTFLQFRLPFLHELSRIADRRRLRTDEAVDLILAASRVFDRLLLALLRGHRDVTSGPVALQ
ncbi:MAG: helix-turn-helix domain-containing protein [Chloroflexota bacterium]|nr:MAG: helix-turn-helix domain-containing protein [Chloroflexota bacterium]